MRGRFSYMWIGLVVLDGTLSCARAEQDDRAKMAATSLMRAVIAQKDYAPCTLAARWDNNPVPESVARRYLHANIHADLEGQTTGAVADVVDPHHDHANAFCSDEDRDRSWASRRADFAQGRGEKLLLHFVKVTFPVFSNDFKDAALVFTNENHHLTRRDGTVVGPDLFVVVSALAFHRTGDRWARIGSEELAIVE